MGTSTQGSDMQPHSEKFIFLIGWRIAHKDFCRPFRLPYQSTKLPHCAEWKYSNSLQNQCSLNNAPLIQIIFSDQATYCYLFSPKISTFSVFFISQHQLDQCSSKIFRLFLPVFLDSRTGTSPIWELPSPHPQVWLHCSLCWSHWSCSAPVTCPQLCAPAPFAPAAPAARSWEESGPWPLATALAKAVASSMAIKHSPKIQLVQQTLTFARQLGTQWYLSSKSKEFLDGSSSWMKAQQKQHDRWCWCSVSCLECTGICDSTTFGSQRSKTVPRDITALWEPVGPCFLAPARWELSRSTAPHHGRVISCRRCCYTHPMSE